MSILEAQSITKAYGPLKVLKGVDFKVDQGEIVTIVGKSGAGKSTLLHILGTLDKPDTGELTICGKSTHRLSSPELARIRNETIGFVFQFLCCVLQLADHVRHRGHEQPQLQLRCIEWQLHDNFCQHACPAWRHWVIRHHQIQLHQAIFQLAWGLRTSRGVQDSGRTLLPAVAVGCSVYLFDFVESW